MYLIQRRNLVIPVVNNIMNKRGYMKDLADPIVNNIMNKRASKIYLAGPDVFFNNAKEIGKLKKEICKKYGFIGLYPLEYDKSKDKLQISRSIYNECVHLMDECDIIVANLTPFRGVSVDPRTAVEIGYCCALKKKAFGYTNCIDTYEKRVTAVNMVSLQSADAMLLKIMHENTSNIKETLDYLDKDLIDITDVQLQNELKETIDELNADESDTLIDYNEMNIENYENTDNLMIDNLIKSSGGIIFKIDASNEDIYTELSAFENCIKYIKLSNN